MKPTTKKIGAIQQKILDALHEHKGWTPRCGWVWSTTSYTQMVLESLVSKGLVVKITHNNAPAYYPAGRKNPYDQPQKHEET